MRLENMTWVQKINVIGNAYSPISIYGFHNVKNASSWYNDIISEKRIHVTLSGSSLTKPHERKSSRAQNISVWKPLREQVGLIHQIAREEFPASWGLALSTTSPCHLTTGDTKRQRGKCLLNCFCPVCLQLNCRSVLRILSKPGFKKVQIKDGSILFWAVSKW